ncbi:MAG TPA: TonB-dependent receptor, partial [Caulobacteraceae bacterium]|nr:TonB-dependent receptor [Caulobacteraceae bacterium]
TIDPDYRANTDLAELQISFDITDSLTLASETAYSVDEVFSMQDFNRFNTAPGAWLQPSDFGPDTRPFRPGALLEGPNGGIFCDPQLGCSDRLVAVDIATSKARQFSQEFRLASDFDGPFNFSLGANWLRADSVDKYYVFINSLSLVAADNGLGLYSFPYVAGQTDNSECLSQGYRPGDPGRTYAVRGCIYMDPNPIGALNDRGHNYFLSKNPYKLISYAVFGEAYYNLADNLKITAGLRWTVDKKQAPIHPSWTLAAEYIDYALADGVGAVGYPVKYVIEQEWREPTGRLAIDWKPDMSFTDDTMIYGSYAHGYKAGGANPPPMTITFYADDEVADIASQLSLTRPTTFEPEFVDAFELGAKNTLADGRVTLNLAAFYYDYEGYQISEIVDRSAFNRNFDATVWGIELESDWRPLENLRLGFKGGYQKTRIADGERAVDLMDRTAGTPGWSVIRPFPTFASNCILPTELYAPPNPRAGSQLFGLGSPNGGGIAGCEYTYLLQTDPVTRLPYEPFPTVQNGGSLNMWPPGTYPGFTPQQPGINNGEGFAKELGGNELPNAPNWTATITADYTLPLPNAWLATLHTDLHWQAESYWRIFNDHEFSRLDEYFTMNLAAIFMNEEAGWNVMAYIKNVTDETAITGAFLNSDDTGLTTNVFLTEPRLYGVRVTKNWSGGSLLGSFGERREGPYPFTLELGGQVQRQDAPYETVRPEIADFFSQTLDTNSIAQNQDLDWGDGRDVRIAWRPGGGAWTVSAGVRYGKANGGETFLHTQEEGDKGCIVGGANGYFLCSPNSPYYYAPAVLGSHNTSDTGAANWEEHEFIDFAVSRDVGLGFGPQARSSVSLGLHYGQLESRTLASMNGIPDWDVLDHNFPKYDGATHHRYQAELLARRSFEGVGPVLSWEQFEGLLGNEEIGHLGVEWSASAGVLFGRQETDITGTYSAAFFQFGLTHTGFGPPLDLDEGAVEPIRRSQSVTAPLVNLSLGLAYEVDRFKASAGYRWERYFDVLDTGYDEHQDGDRTIDGPYFKLSVGFGG